MSYVIAGYSIALGVLAIYGSSLAIRLRRARRRAGDRS